MTIDSILLAARGPTGPTGPTGPQGPKGDNGDPTLSADLASTDPGKGAELVSRGSVTVASFVDIADVPAEVGQRGMSINLASYHPNLNKGGGVFTWDATSTDVDDGGTIVTPSGHSGPGRWVRRIDGCVDVCMFGAKGDGSTDDTAALNNCILATPVGRILVPAGSYLTDGGHVLSDQQELAGEGIRVTTITLSPSSSNDELITLGNRSAAQLTLHTGLSDVTLDMSGTSKRGFGMYGCRDGSFVKNVYITNFSGKAYKFGLGGDGVGTAAGLMNQGVEVTQLIAQTFEPITAPEGVADINGCFETTFNTCKVLGRSTEINNCVAFFVGRESQCRNVVFINAAIGNLLNNGSGGNGGFTYGPLAQECRDIFSTFENIHGHATAFEGVSGNNLPFQCYTLYPRLYMGADPDNMSPAFVFGTSSYCKVSPVAGYSNSKIWALFKDAPNQSNNSIEMHTVLDPAGLKGTNIIFELGSSNTNFAHGISTQGSVVKHFTITNNDLGGSYHADGTLVTYGGGYHTYVSPTVGVRWRDSDSNSLFQVSSANPTSDQTAVLIRYSGGSGVAFERVTVGEADSGGVGFRVLRVPN